MPAWFPGVDSAYFLVGDITPFNPAGAFTLYCEILPVKETGTIFTKWQGSADRSFLFNFTAANTTWNILGTDANEYGVNGPPLKMGQWNYVAAIFTPGAVRIFVNDHFSADTGVGGGVNINNSSPNVAMGARLDVSDPSRSMIRNVATWNAALTLPELLTVKRITPRGIHLDTLSAYWPLAANLSDISNQNDIGAEWARNGKSHIIEERSGSSILVVPIGGAPNPNNDDLATVYVDITASGTDVADIHDNASVYVDLQTSGTDAAVYTDATTIRLVFTIDSHDCHTLFSPEFVARLYRRLDSQAYSRWTGTMAYRRFEVIAGDGLEEC